MKRSLIMLLLVGVCLSPAARLKAQSEMELPHAPDGSIREHVEGIFIPSMNDAPFTAKVTVEITHTLQDGTMIAQKYYTHVARDSPGRVYRETRNRVPIDSDREPQLVNSFVIDPAAKTRTTCVRATRVCTITNWWTGHVAEEPVGLSRDGKSSLGRTDLGTSTLETLEVHGTKETRTYNPGAFGNDKPVAVTKEFLYAPRLEINLAVTRQDPRTGEQKLEVTELKLAEPEPSQFSNPEGYKVVDARSAVRMGSGPVSSRPSESQ